MDKDERPACNLVFLLDTSGSMNAPNKLPLVIEGMQMLLEATRREGPRGDRRLRRVGRSGARFDIGEETQEDPQGVDAVAAGGSTNGGAGIALAYQTARDHFIPEGVNRVILCTDGDFNVGTTGTDELVRMVEQRSQGGRVPVGARLRHGQPQRRDAGEDQRRGNGNYAFIDTDNEARKVLVEQISGTLVTIAKDVKIQVEFNPAKVAAYRLIGYENRMLAKEDFNDDKKDAGEIGAGHTVTALVRNRSRRRRSGCKSTEGGRS